MRPLEIDWDLVKLAFIAGSTLSELSEELGINLGTLRSRCHREKWTAQRNKVTNVTRAKVTRGFREAGAPFVGDTGEDADETGETTPADIPHIPDSVRPDDGRRLRVRRLTEAQLVEQLQGRGRHYQSVLGDKMAEVASHIRSLTPGEVLSAAQRIKHIDDVARRTFRIDGADGGNRLVINLGFLQNFDPPEAKAVAV